MKTKPVVFIIFLVAIVTIFLSFGSHSEFTAPKLPPKGTHAPAEPSLDRTSSPPLAKPAITVSKVEERISSGDSDPLKDFVHDPSFKARCHTHTVPPLGHCPKREEFKFTDRRPVPLMGPISKGATTKDMEVKPMKEIMGVEKDMRHHPIFDVYAERTWTVEWLPQRVIEFVGVHTDYRYDCEGEIDFRQYHQVRAAMCLTYDKLAETMKEGTGSNQTEASSDQSPVTVQYGMYPLVDEEYFEYIMTLTTAWDAAMRGENYTFIELGARYGTWIVRGGGAFRMFAPTTAENPLRLRLLAVEGSCEWYQKMKEHITCNGFEAETELVMAYAAPVSYNQVKVGSPDTYTKARAVSLLEMLPRYSVVNMIDFDIQKFEHITVEEPGAFQLMTEKVAFAHFGTHGTDIEKRLLTLFQSSGRWCTVYFFAGAHTKKLHKGHRCQTPHGPSGFNDGSLGFANLKFYPQLEASCAKVPTGSLKNIAKTCHWIPQALEILRRKA